MRFPQIYIVKNRSMEPTVRPGHWLLVSRSVYRRIAPSRGDLVIVSSPEETTKRYLKRIVGLPGEEVKSEEGLLFLDGERLSEPYLAGLPAVLGLEGAVWSLGSDRYFVMGDNRAHSTDSRHFGPITRDMIAGKAVLRCWPPTAFGQVA